MNEPKIVGTLFLEVNDPDGYHGVVEVAMIETPDGEVTPGGVRDADDHQNPERVPLLDQVREAIETAKWCYLNQAVFEGVVSNNTLADWNTVADYEPNHELTDQDPELN